jgi:Reverse transcriptase (RNA-dependent DNA polymerase)
LYAISVQLQWKNAKIIPLKKPEKGNYTIANAWRPISLLATLGKILESVLAERISYATETFGLLPANHFGARKQRSTEQAILVLQECVYKAWRSRKVLSLISFDVKGAYNGVYKERLLQRLQARGIPPIVVQWIGAFCSNRIANVVVNGYTAPQKQLPQAGLPQGSPLSPILFLFFNADLVQQRIDSKGGAIAFVDDYTAWVTGPSAEVNHIRIQQIVDRAVEWEKRSGATFKSTKTVLVHFTRTASRLGGALVMVKGEVVAPKPTAKILGVILDSELRYKSHIARTATKGLKAALALKRLRLLSPLTAQQLFSATVAPVMDYASNVWMHAAKGLAMAMLNRAQRVGGQAIIGAFKTTAVAIAEAEAYIRPVHQRLGERATKLWIGIHTLPNTHPLKSVADECISEIHVPTTENWTITPANKGD